MSTEWPPRRDADLLEFALQYSAQITAAPVPLGLTAPMAVSLAGYVSDFQTTLAAATNGVTRGPSTVFAKNESRKNLVAYVRLTARQIQGTSTVTDQQRKDLKLPVRSEPTPGREPGTPFNFKVSLTNTGAVVLKWKCNNPRGLQGVMYQVWRRIEGGQPVYCGGCGKKTYTDTDIPAGTTNVTYDIQAVRSTAVGPWATFNVFFGMGGGTTVAEQPAKMAA